MEGRIVWKGIRRVKEERKEKKGVTEGKRVRGSTATGALHLESEKEEKSGRKVKALLRSFHGIGKRRGREAEGRRVKEAKMSARTGGRDVRTDRSLK